MSSAQPRRYRKRKASSAAAAPRKTSRRSKTLQEACYMSVLPAEISDKIFEHVIDDYFSFNSDRRNLTYRDYTSDWPTRGCKKKGHYLDQLPALERALIGFPRLYQGIFRIRMKGSVVQLHHNHTLGRPYEYPAVEKWSPLMQSSIKEVLILTSIIGSKGVNRERLLESVSSLLTDKLLVYTPQIKHLAINLKHRTRDTGVKFEPYRRILMDGLATFINNTQLQSLKLIDEPCKRVARGQAPLGLLGVETYKYLGETCDALWTLKNLNTHIKSQPGKSNPRKRIMRLIFQVKNKGDKLVWTEVEKVKKVGEKKEGNEDEGEDGDVGGFDQYGDFDMSDLPTGGSMRDVMRR
ncbi:hypothetical protein B7494_g7623 [Chlorociboria aeruginascens]|nr:hypothetical protein B7494_g7623 [Chlorociboria aeruginascens]